MQKLTKWWPIPVKEGDYTIMHGERANLMMNESQSVKEKSTPKLYE
jgi:hypothetical protein